MSAAERRPGQRKLPAVERAGENDRGGGARRRGVTLENFALTGGPGPDF